MRVLLTGASGRLGPHVVKDLEDAGHEVVLFSRRDLEETYPKNRIIIGDITDPDACYRALDGGFDAVQHCAAQPYPTDHPDLSEKAAGEGRSFDTTMRSNILGTYNLLHGALRRDVGIFVMTGSNCSLGHGFRISGSEFRFEYLPVGEDHPTDVEDSYSFSKLTGERLLEMYSRTYGLRTYTLRAAGICDADRRRKTRENAKPSESWNPWLWCWVGSEDVASAHRLLMEKAGEIEANGVYFCNADDTTALEPTRELIECWKPSLTGLAEKLSGFDSILSNRRLKQAVGWRHETSWRNTEGANE